MKYTQQQNSVDERKNLMFVEKQVVGANLPLKFWAEPINTALNLCIDLLSGSIMMKYHFKDVQKESHLDMFDSKHVL